jgi:DNA-binding Xre family transcriptional regulator
MMTPGHEWAFERSLRNMKISYKKLWHLLIELNMNKQDLKRVSGISTASIAKLGRGENLQTDVLLKICKALNVGINDIMDTVEDGEES